MDCPVFTRYATREMSQIFSEEAKIQRWLEVEAALAEAQAELEIIPKEAAEEISKKANLNYVSMERIKEIEKRIDHDLLAVVNALAEVCDKGYGRYVHMGATSYDIEDTAWALAFRDALLVIRNRLKELVKILISKAKEYKELVCIGRTHGQHALPMTYGMKFALWSYDIFGCIKRLDFFLNNSIEGKMSGAVGTFAGFGDKGIELQNKVMEKLNLKPSLITNQIVQRDKFADIIYLLAIISACLEKIAKEIRNLQRTEISEVLEPFSKEQAGSSAMPHKRNPHGSERICSLARYLRALIHVALENVALEHERDLTNSANERIILTHSFMLTDFMLLEMISIIKGLTINVKNVQRNLNLMKGANLSERILIKLVEKGLPRHVAYEIVKNAAIKSFEEDLDFVELLYENELIKEKITKDELKQLVNPYEYIGLSKEVVDLTIKQIEQLIS
jgi:adenylosuccinate lyase